MQGPSCRNMDEMWDDTETERCRQAFIKGLYKFPRCPTAPLRSGRPMPLLGVGPWRTAEGGVQDVVEKALRSGIRCARPVGALRAARPLSEPGNRATSERPSSWT